MDRCTWETRRMLQRILAGWHELAPVLPDLERHLAETTNYPVQVQHHELSVSAARIAKFLAEEHGQPSAAIGHLHDWLVGVAGAQLRGDWVAFLARVQGAPGLTVHERADLVVIAGVLCFPPVTPVRADGRRLVEMATHALVIGSPSLLLEDLSARQEQQLAWHARQEVEKSRSGPPPLRETDPPVLPPPRERRRVVAAAVGLALLVTAGLVTAVSWPGGPAPLPDQKAIWTAHTVDPGGTAFATVDVPAGAKRLEAELTLRDANPDTGACNDLTAELSTDQGGSSGPRPLGAKASVPVPSGRSAVRLTLRLAGMANCTQTIDIPSIRFTR
ncbi:hypothetical protein HUT16_09265 [Kitasatospora sp. NA04385]|uniref:hypothetical protein n=1 Tax=Kitasatospora sp. NA04385 TaxID=2742135 RepID=UPI0015924094|nr:hypothetical protein [Kitasatospora sp. NA04385]QKW19230.1 hypothetical protein HUT16_09265 [Kitasatospora sp. NA04385]